MFKSNRFGTKKKSFNSKRPTNFDDSHLYDDNWESQEETDFREFQEYKTEMHENRNRESLCCVSWCSCRLVRPGFFTFENVIKKHSAYYCGKP